MQLKIRKKGRKRRKTDDFICCFFKFMFKLKIKNFRLFGNITFHITKITLPTF